MIREINYLYSQGFTNLVKMRCGFAVIIYNSATYYITISISGECQVLTEGTPNSLISGVDYNEGCVRVKMNYVTQMETVIFAPGGDILI